MSLRAVPLLLLAVSVAADCPPGSKFDSYFNKCYQFFPSPLSFLAAEQKCNSIGGHLADVQNAFENFYVAGEGGASNFWIGANLLLASNWTWTSSSPMIFSNWGNGQPTNSNYCAYVKDSDHTWGTQPCNTQLPFMCTSNPNATIPGICPSEDPAPTCTPDSCPYNSYCTDGYSLYTRNCLCYKYVNIIFLKFSDAQAFCAYYGGMLAKITSDDVNEFLTLLPGYQTFGTFCPRIGLTCDGHTPSSCSWIDGTPLGNYTHFYEDINPGTYFLQTGLTYAQNGYWARIPATDQYSLVCQKESNRSSLFSEEAAMKTDSLMRVG